MKKKFLNIILAIAMLACMIPMGMVTVSAEQKTLEVNVAASGDNNKDFGTINLRVGDTCRIKYTCNSTTSVYIVIKESNAVIDDYPTTKFSLDGTTKSGYFSFTAIKEGKNTVQISRSSATQGTTVNSANMRGKFTVNVTDPKTDDHEADTTKYMYNSDAHWYACKADDCGLKTVADYEKAFADSTNGEALKTTLGYEAHDFINGVCKCGAHTHTASDTWMTDGRAHWLKCGADNCPLKTVEDYEIAFSSYYGEELKETLKYSETCDSMLMGRQGKVNDGVVSNTDGRTIIGLTQDQLDNIGNKLVIVGCDDSDSNKQVSVDVDCAYTWFYNGEDKIEAGVSEGVEDCAAFVIIDSALVGDTITGYGYYRVYNDTVSDGNLIGEALYVAPRTFKAVYDITNEANTLNFYYDTIDHSGENKTVYDNLPTEATTYTSWEYNGIRKSVKGVAIDPTVIKYKGLKSTNEMFYNMLYAERFSGAEYLDVSGVTDMSDMFRYFAQGKSKAPVNIEDVPDVSRWNTAKVTTMYWMFSSYGENSTSLKNAPDVSHWNTANVTNMQRLFNCYGAYCNELDFTLDLSGWNVGKVTDVSIMLKSAGKSAKIWEVTIPAKTNETDNDSKHWYIGDGTDATKYIEPDPTGVFAK